MSDDLAPEERIAAGLERVAAALGKWAAETRQMLRPVIARLAELAEDPHFQGELRRRELLTGQRSRSDCQCLCAVVHPGEHVCDGQAVTTVRRHSDVTGDVDVPTCAPCAAELMAQAL